MNGHEQLCDLLVAPAGGGALLPDLSGDAREYRREVRLLDLVLLVAVDAPLLPVLGADVVILRELVLQRPTNL